KLDDARLPGGTVLTFYLWSSGQLPELPQPGACSEDGGDAAVPEWWPLHHGSGCGLEGRGIPRLWLRLPCSLHTRRATQRDDRDTACYVVGVAGDLSRDPLPYRAGLL